VLYDSLLLLLFLFLKKTRTSIPIQRRYQSKKKPRFYVNLFWNVINKNKPKYTQLFVFFSMINFKSFIHFALSYFIKWNIYVYIYLDMTNLTLHIYIHLFFD